MIPIVSNAKLQFINTFYTGGIGARLAAEHSGGQVLDLVANASDIEIRAASAAAARNAAGVVNIFIGQNLCRNSYFFTEEFPILMANQKITTVRFQFVKWSDGLQRPIHLLNHQDLTHTKVQVVRGLKPFNNYLQQYLRTAPSQ